MFSFLFLFSLLLEAHLWGWRRVGFSCWPRCLSGDRFFSFQVGTSVFVTNGSPVCLMCSMYLVCLLFGAIPRLLLTNPGPLRRVVHQFACITCETIPPSVWHGAIQYMASHPFFAASNARRVPNPRPRSTSCRQKSLND